MVKKLMAISFGIVTALTSGASMASNSFWTYVYFDEPILVVPASETTLAVAGVHQWEVRSVFVELDWEDFSILGVDESGSPVIELRSYANQDLDHMQNGLFTGDDVFGNYWRQGDNVIYDSLDGPVANAYLDAIENDLRPEFLEYGICRGEEPGEFFGCLGTIHPQTGPIGETGQDTIRCNPNRFCECDGVDSCNQLIADCAEKGGAYTGIGAPNSMGQDKAGKCVP